MARTERASTDLFHHLTVCLDESQIRAYNRGFNVMCLGFGQVFRQGLTSHGQLMLSFELLRERSVQSRHLNGEKETAVV
jgi:hypothetical protein